MKSAIHQSDSHPWHRFDANTGRGFVCILDTRPARRNAGWDLAVCLFLCAALLATVMFLGGAWDAPRPVHPLRLDDDALHLAEWESPTGFLLADDFPPTPTELK